MFVFVLGSRLRLGGWLALVVRAGSVIGGDCVMLSASLCMVMDGRIHLAPLGLVPSRNGGGDGAGTTLCGRLVSGSPAT